MTLKRHLKARHLFAIAVGMVISGQYFGWNFGFAVGGLYGLVIAAAIVTLFYLCFMFSYAELATAIPYTGGASAYAKKAFGPFMGYMAGIICLVEFVFAPPAIAVAIGSYMHFLWSSINPHVAAISAFILCIGINLMGTRYVALFEMLVTALALLGLVIYYGAGLPQIKLVHLMPAHQLLGHGVTGIFAAIPFAIWLYLCIEGAAMAAEEVENPKRDILMGFIAAVGVLALCSVLTILVTAGIGANLAVPTDYPLPHALAIVYSQQKWLPLLVDILGLFGLFASLNGIIIGYSRQVYSLARGGNLPRIFTRLSSRHVPHWALMIPGVLGIICAGSANVSNSLIILAVFGAVVGYCLSLLALFKLRWSAPALERPFKVIYPSVPLIALCLGFICLASVAFFAILPGRIEILGEKVSLVTIIISIVVISITYYVLRAWLARRLNSKLA